MEERRKIAQAKKLISQGRSNEARRLLKNNSNPLAKKILLELDNYQLTPSHIPSKTEEAGNAQIINKRINRSIWDIDENVPPIVLKAIAVDLLLLLIVLPAVIFIKQGKFKELLFLPLMIPVIPIVIFIYYIRWKIYWSCTGIIAFFVMIILLSVLYGYAFGTF